MENPIRRYLEDAIAAEKSFETQLEGFAKEASLPEAQRMFQQHAAETRTQYELLTSRLEALGGSTSTIKSFLAHLFNSAPKSGAGGTRKGRANHTGPDDGFCRGERRGRDVRGLVCCRGNGGRQSDGGISTPDSGAGAGDRG